VKNEDHGIPPNKYNPHAWIINNPEIGEDTWIGAFTVIDGKGGLKIGRGCNISCGVHIITHSTVKRCVTERKYSSIEKSQTVIEDHVFIGEHATVLMGAHIGHHSIVAAGTVVKEGMIIPSYSLVAGVPGRIVRNIRDEIEEWIDEKPVL
jgi:acetyltransferase-like isoleucine patch superfamily enzyme